MQIDNGSSKSNPVLIPNPAQLQNLHLGGSGTGGFDETMSESFWIRKSIGRITVIEHGLRRNSS
jgi:hypothetical protein